MAQVEAASAWGPLGDALKGVFQTAYVTDDTERACATAAAIAGPFDSIDIALDVLGEDAGKIGEMHVRASFAMERSFEIVEPLSDTTGLWTPPGGAPSAEPLVFHHLGSIVEDLEGPLAAARAGGLPVVRLRAEGMDVAFVDFRPRWGGPLLELLCPQH